MPRVRSTVQSPIPTGLVLPDHFSNSDSFLSHGLRLSRSIRVNEKVRLLLMGEGFNIFNIANLTGYSSTLARLSQT